MIRSDHLSDQTLAAPAEADKKEEQKEEKKEEKEDKKEDKEEKKADAPAPQKSKRTSLFGNFFQKVASPTHEKSEKEATAPAESGVASTAPQLDNPVEEAAVKPIEPESVTAQGDSAAVKDASPAESPAAETPPAVKETKDKRRSTSFFGSLGMRKEKKGSDDEATDSESKPKNKLGGLFRKPSKAVKADNQKENGSESEAKPEPVAKDEPAKAEDKAEEKAAEEKPAESKPAENAESKTEDKPEDNKPVNVASTSTTVEAAA